MLRTSCRNSESRMRQQSRQSVHALQQPCRLASGGRSVEPRQPRPAVSSRSIQTKRTALTAPARPPMTLSQACHSASPNIKAPALPVASGLAEECKFCVPPPLRWFQRKRLCKVQSSGLEIATALCAGAEAVSSSSDGSEDASLQPSDEEDAPGAPLT